jgi:poly-D-alanine transfer protein DltD
MWKRERMMVDVISLQTTTATTTTTTTTKNNDLQDKAPLQNRQYYPIGGGMIHDDANNFYAGNEYTMTGELRTQKSKRLLPFSNESTSTRKKQRLVNTQHYQTYQPSPLKTSYVFTSKPYDVMDNLMHYY